MTEHWWLQGAPLQAISQSDNYKEIQSDLSDATNNQLEVNQLRLHIIKINYTQLPSSEYIRTIFVNM